MSASNNEMNETMDRLEKLKKGSLTKQDVVASQKFSNIERTEMLISLGRALGKPELAQKLYVEEHSGKSWFSNVPEVKIFPILLKLMSKYGNFNYSFETDDEQQSETSDKSSDEEDFDETSESSSSDTSDIFDTSSSDSDSE